MPIFPILEKWRQEDPWNTLSGSLESAELVNSKFNERSCLNKVGVIKEGT